MFALDLEGLRAHDVTVWTAWSEDGDLLGCPEESGEPGKDTIFDGLPASRLRHRRG